MSGIRNEPITRKRKEESEMTKSQSECIESICKTFADDENLQNSELKQIIEAIDEYLRGVNESNDLKKSKFSDQKLSGGVGNKIKSACKQIGKFFEGHRKTIVNVLSTVGSSHWTAIGIVLVASALDRLEIVKENRKECLMLLKSMNDLAKIVFELKGLPHETVNTQEKMKEAIHMIIEGAIMCAEVTQANKKNGMDRAHKYKEMLSHLRRGTKETRNAPDYKEKLLDIRRETKEMRNTLHTQISVCIFKWVCENGKESREKKYISPNTQDGVVIDDKSPGNDNSTVAKQTRDVSNKRDCDTPETPSPSKRAKNWRHNYLNQTNTSKQIPLISRMVP